MGIKLTTSVVIATDCIGSYKSNYHYHMIMTMMAPTRNTVILNMVFILYVNGFIGVK